ncbi:MAG: hypothetical protein QM769_14390 [Pseudoxanthomonas sp.]
MSAKPKFRNTPNARFHRYRRMEPMEFITGLTQSVAIGYALGAVAAALILFVAFLLSPIFFGIGAVGIVIQMAFSKN